MDYFWLENILDFSSKSILKKKRMEELPNNVDIRF